MILVLLLVIWRKKIDRKFGVFARQIFVLWVGLGRLKNASGSNGKQKILLNDLILVLLLVIGLDLLKNASESKYWKVKKP